jgi:biotin carboxylase
MSIPRTLLVDTNRAAYPIYRALCELGHEVWVVGGKPEETLAKLAANYTQLDYSDADALAAFVQQKAFDYLVPGCTDLSYQVCAQISQGRFPGIDSPAVTAAINHKAQFRTVAGDLGLPVPGILSLAEAAGQRAVIVKPVDSFSGRGMTILQEPSPQSLDVAFDQACRASKTGRALIEEFVAGQLYSHSAFVQDGAVIADFVVQEDCTTNPFTVDTSRVAFDFRPALRDSLRRDIGRLAVALRLNDGLVHTQFITQGDEYWIIEVTRRCPGDLYSLLIEFSTGYPYAASYAAPFVGGNAACLETPTVQDRIIRHTVTSKSGASLWGFRFSQPVDIRLFLPLATAGDFIEPSPYGRAALFFLHAASEFEQQTLYQQLVAGELYSFR